jgi:ABC-type multidrug transport system ATPase subunit
MGEVADICDRVIFLSAGRVVAAGRPGDLAASADATRVCLRVEAGLDQLVGYAHVRGLPCRVVDRDVDVEIDERYVASFSPASPLRASTTRRSPFASRRLKTTS